MSDEDEAIVLYQAPGAICKKRASERGGPRGRNTVRWDGTYVDAVWQGPGTLRLHVPGAAHSVLREWNEAEQRFEGWYVNLESPWTRTAIGFDSWDHILDVEVTDDLTTWAWKDVDELEWSVENGYVTTEFARDVREEGERVAAAIERRAWPFVDDWSAWAPDPTWPIPSVPAGWDAP